MVDLGHEKVVACDTTFETNDTKVYCQFTLNGSFFQDQHGFPN
jgi:hypothetical protein